MQLVIALLLAGALLFAAEIYLPGFIAAKFGLLALFLAVIFGFRRFGPTGGTWTLLIALAIIGVGGFAYFKFFGRSGAARGIISQGVSATPLPPHLNLVDQIGETLSPLRPGGTAQFGLERVDVVSDGTPIEIGQRVQVVTVEGNRVVVRAV